MNYATAADYEFLSINREIPAELQEVYLEDASRQIDSLTCCRIPKIGFRNLSLCRQKLVRTAVVRQADLQYNFRDVLESPLSSYGINGVSIGLDRASLVTRGGVSTLPSIAALLEQTGLMCRRLS